MSDKIQVKRGLKADLPTLDIGEYGFCTDTKELFIGTADGNELINQVKTAEENTFTAKQKINVEGSDVTFFQATEQNGFDISLANGVLIGETEYINLEDLFTVEISRSGDYVSCIFTPTPLVGGFGGAIIVPLYFSFSEVLSPPIFTVINQDNIFVDDYYVDDGDGNMVYNYDDYTFTLSDFNFLYAFALFLEWDDSGVFEIRFPDVFQELALTELELSNGMSFQNADNSFILAANHLSKNASNAYIINRSPTFYEQELDGKHIFGDIDFDAKLSGGFITVGFSAYDTRYNLDYIMSYSLADAEENTTKLQEALNRSYYEKRPLLLRGGTYYIRGNLTVRYSIYGTGGAILRLDGLSTHPNILNITSSGVTISNIKFSENSSTIYPNAFISVDDDNCTIENCQFSSRYTEYSIQVTGGVDTKILNNRFTHETSSPAKVGVRFENGVGLALIKGNTFDWYNYPINIHGNGHRFIITDNLMYNMSRSIFIGEQSYCLGVVFSNNCIEFSGSQIDGDICIRAKIGQSVITNNVVKRFTYNPAIKSITLLSSSGVLTGRNIIANNVLENLDDVEDNLEDNIIVNNIYYSA